jgi:hypothetical protein
MTDSSMTPESPDAAETANFLRRFADLMSTGYNAAYLHRAAELLETLSVRVSAASDEDQLWRYKYESLTHHADALEAECDALKNDIEGHLDITSSILAERDALGTALLARDAELSELDAALNRQRGELAATQEAHEEAKAELHAAFDRERVGLKSMMEKVAGELAELRFASERERDELKASIKAGEQSLAELRLAFDRERNDLKAKLTVRDDELAAFRVVSRREADTLLAKVAALEAKRTELRSAFDRIGDLRNQTVGPQGSIDASFSGKSGLAAEAAAPPLAQWSDPDPAVGDANAVVPKTTLRQARAQFEYLAKEFIPLGDIASQVMCELGAYTMDLALVAGRETNHLPVDEVALSILAPPAPASQVVADKV